MHVRSTIVAAAVVAGLSTVALADTLDLTVNGLVTPSFRGDSNTTYFGWDIFELTTTPGSFGQAMLDDTTPDVGTYVGGDAHIVQDASLTYGHRSGSSNYYSGFNPTDYAGDTITAPTDGPGTGVGFTTIVLQVLGSTGSGGPTPSPGNPISDLVFDDVNGVSPTVYYAQKSDTTGHYLVVYELTGNQSTYDIHFSSFSSSRAIDAFIVDTIYSANAGAFDDIVVVPEPTALALLATPAIFCLRRRRRGA